jgi:(R,R)-butanediol dehydrogenase/meso-butanediol dehydrogenase/diacetyl reductase
MYHGPGEVRLEEVPVPEPGRGELLIRVATAGICGTDVSEYTKQPRFFPVDEPHPHSGHFGPTIPGHEFSGWVAEVGDEVEGFHSGDLVAVGSGVSCGRCSPCRNGNTNMCQSYWTVGLHANGGLAEMAVAPASCTLNLAGSSITPDLAALTQPMSIGVHATSRGRITPDDRVTVLGTGGIGSFITFAAARTGAEVTAVDVDPVKLETASRLGASRVVDLSAADDNEVDTSPTVVFECTGRPDSLGRGLRIVSDNGRLVVVGHQSQPVEADFWQIAMRELEVIGTMAHAFRPDFGKAAALLTDDPGAWASVAPRVLPLEQIVSAGLEPMAKGDSPQIKVLFDPSTTHPRQLRTG